MRVRDWLVRLIHRLPPRTYSQVGKLDADVSVTLHTRTDEGVVVAACVVVAAESDNDAAMALIAASRTTIWRTVRLTGDEIRRMVVDP